MRAKYKLSNGLVLAWWCDFCGGDGKKEILKNGVVEYRDEEDLVTVDCGECDGIGYITTEDGAQILALVQDMIERNKE